MFAALGALTSQLSANRGQAATLAAVVLGAAFVIRMIADSKTSLGWLRWLSPLGWLEELHPLQNVQPMALVPIAGLVLGCSALSVVLAARRDLQASIMREPDSAAGSARGLLGPLTLAVRVSWPSYLAWLTSMTLMAALYGSLTRSAATILTSSPTVTAALGRLGIRRVNEGYLSVVFLIMAVFIGVLAASQIGSIRDEEASGRLDNLLVRPVRRATWFLGRVGLAAGLVLASGV
jgi:ABC-2 type transport system permease protein